MLWISLLTLLATQQVYAGATTYRAAVVEYSTPYTPLLSADQVMLNNAAAYVEYMTNASRDHVDIIVFPESTLHGHLNRAKFIEVPSPDDSDAPCDSNSSYHPALVLLSCAARELRLYIVVNLLEKTDNPTTNESERYNTNVAFNRAGTVVGRYRKFNPYGEGVNKPSLPDHSYFLTDFGVHFGLFTCFDIEFLEPAIVMAREFGIGHFAFPHCWNSELPFLTALQAHWGWAYSLNVVLLAAGCNQPLEGGTGTGIYAGRQGALGSFQTNALASKMITADVPVSLVAPLPSTYFEAKSKMRYHNQPGDHLLGKHLHESPAPHNSSLEMLRDFLDVYKSVPLLPPGRVSGSLQGNSSIDVSITADTILCHNDFCCDFQVRMTSTFSTDPPTGENHGDDFSQYWYRLVVFDGVRWYGGGLATGGIQVCGVVPCVNNSQTSCGLRADHQSRQPQTITTLDHRTLYKTATVFHHVSVTASFYFNNTFIYPDVFVSGSADQFGALVPSDHFTYETFGPYNHTLLSSLALEVPTPRLITAALYARQFDRDGQKRTELSHSLAHPPLQSIFIFCILFLLVFHCIFSKMF